VGRKTLRDGGRTARAVAAQIEATEAELQASGSAHALALREQLQAARLAFLDAVAFVLEHAKANPNAVFAGSVPYLLLGGNLVAGWQLARALLVAERELAAGREAEFMRTKILTARFYADHLLSRAGSQRDSIVAGHAAVTEISPDAF